MGTLAFLLLVLIPSARAVDHGPWELLNDKEGVETYRTEVPDSPLYGFRGVAEVDVHISRILGLFRDTDKSMDWVDMLAEIQVPQRYSDYEILIYQRYDLAWPVSDRDYVVRSALEHDVDAKRVTLVFKSVDDARLPPVDGVVRATTDRTAWAFTALPGGRTHIDVEVFTDPKGDIPAWLVNVVQRGWARTSIHALAARASKDDIVPVDRLVGW